MFTLTGILMAVSMHAATVEQHAADLEERVSALEMQIEDMEPEYVTEYVEVPVYVETTDYVECGTCGAHVSEWWYTTSYDGELVEICGPCHQIDLEH